MVRKIVHKIKRAIGRVEEKILRRRAASHGYIISKPPGNSIDEIVISNYFQTAHLKNALVSYIVSPFLGHPGNHHSNNRECMAMAEILSELGYNVDIINWNNISFRPGKSYDIVIDNHNNLERLSPYLGKDTKKIFHATNCHWLFQNTLEYKRYSDLFLKEGIAVLPPRLMSPGNSASYSDVISIFGNEFTRKSYGNTNKRFCHLPMSVTTIPHWTEHKDYDASKNKFVWLNSHGILLKGLDIVIGAFKDHPQFELHIFGNFENENILLAHLKTIASANPNIKFHGWVDTAGALFNEIVNDSAWILGTSFSEGGGGSILNGMAYGLIPVISRSSAITLPADTGFYLEDNSIAELSGVLDRISKLPGSVLKNMSAHAHGFIAGNHTLELFKKNYKDFLEKVIMDRYE